MKLLLFFLLNEPYETIVHAAETPWKSKLNQRLKIKKIDCVYPTGLLSIAAYVKKHIPDIEIKILDCNAMINQLAEQHPEGLLHVKREIFFEKCVEPVADFHPDVIGFSSLFCSNFLDMEPFCSFLKQRFPKCLLVGGGHLPTAIFARIFAAGSSIDAIAFGEGEIPMLGLCRAYLNRREREFLEEDTSWITAEKLQKNPDFRPERHLLENLDEIPPFDFDMLEFPELYFNSSNYFFVIDTKQELREIFIFSTRGCPHHCVFCASQNVHEHRVRSYSTERIKQDILYYHRKFGIRRMVFYDDHFLVNKSRAIEILNFITENGLIAEIPTPAFFSLTPEVAAAMHRAGIRESNVTIESGNENTLKKIMHKPANLKKAEEAVRNLHQVGILAVSNILIGLPGETPESIEESIKYLMTTEINWFQCFVAAPLPGSELYDICVQNHYLEGDDIFSMDFKKCIIRTPEFSPDFIEWKVYEMNLRLNFINNYDMRNGNFLQALKIFERILERVLPTHAMAYYFAAKCCLELKLPEKYEQYKKRYGEMVESYPFWKKWVDFYQLPPLAETGESGIGSK